MEDIRRLSMEAEQIKHMGRRLRKFLQEFDDCFTRSEPREHLRTYVAGQLSNLPRKSIEPIALAHGIRVAAWTFDEWYGRDGEFLDGLLVAGAKLHRRGAGELYRLAARAGNSAKAYPDPTAPERSKTAFSAAFAPSLAGLPGEKFGDVFAGVSETKMEIFSPQRGGKGADCLGGQVDAVLSPTGAAGFAGAAAYPDRGPQCPATNRDQIFPFQPDGGKRRHLALAVVGGLRTIPH